MVFSGAAILSLSGSIAKLIAGLSTNQPDIVIDGSIGLAEIIANTTHDVVLKKKAQRQFEAIGDEIADNLSTVLETDLIAKDVNLEAVALGAADALNRVRLSSKILVQTNLDATALAVTILSESDYILAHYSKAEAMIFKRIINEACERIVQIASRFSGFTEATFSELLKRDNQLLDMTKKMLEEVRGIREKLSLKGLDEETAQYIRMYLDRVKQKLDKVEYYGFDVWQSANPEKLSVAYIPLTTREYLSDDYTIKHSPVSQHNKEDEDFNLETINEVLAENQRLAICGQPGSGKTTLLQWIAVQCATQAFQGELAYLNEKIPYYIPLRLTNNEFPRPDTFVRFTAELISNLIPSKWVYSQLDSGKAIVLIDGIDEISDRSAMYTWLAELVETFPKSNFVITSRHSAMDSKKLIALDFDISELQPMTIPDICLFVDHWHNALCEVLHDDTQKEQIKKLASELKDTIELNKSLLSLATNPLLCAMICAFHRVKNGAIPSDRLTLYDACCRMLTSDRDVERKISLKQYPTLTYKQQLRLLGDIAFYLLRNNESDSTDIPLTIVRDRLTRSLSTLENLPESATPDKVLRYLLERSAIIREPIAGYVDFTHRTFQEYLAAQEIVYLGEIGFLINNAHDDLWREVIILASGLADRPARKELIERLLKRGDKEVKRAYQFHLLAVACLETVTEIEPELKAQISSRLANLIPPTMNTAKLLASAGELAVTPLSKFTDANMTAAAACIRSLAYIGSESALKAIKGYNKNSTRKVRGEIIRAWDYFDREKYAKDVLASLDLRKLDVTSLVGIQYLNTLQELTISRLSEKTNINSLPRLKNLSTLILDGFANDLRITKIVAVLKKMPSLKSLRLANFWQSSLSPFTQLDQIISLTIDSCSLPEPVDLSFLGDMQNLQSLTIRQPIVTNMSLDFLLKLSNLRVLSLIGFHEQPNLKPLANLKNLERLDLIGFSRLADISTLCELPHLTEIKFASCKSLADISCLAVTSLNRVVTIALCEKLRELSAFSNHPNIQVHKQL